MSEQTTIRLVIVDDHVLVRRGIRYSVMTFEDIELVGEAGSGEEVLRLCDEVHPDVVLMDMRISGEMDGVAAIAAIMERHPQIGILALSSFHDQSLVLGAMQAGAIGYLVKVISGEELANAIRAAHAGKATLAREAMEALMQSAPPKNQEDFQLTEREQEVLELLSLGLSNAQIAQALTVTVATAKYHVSNILGKLGVSNRFEAVALARELGLIPSSSP